MAMGSTDVLGFITEFTPSRTGTSGADGLGDGDVFGVGGPNQIEADLGVAAPEGNQAFLMQDTDGRVSMYFDYVDLSGTASPALRMDYMLSETTWERSSGQNDRFYVRVEIDQCVSASTITLLDTDGGGSAGNNGGDIDALAIEGAWNTLSADLSAFVGCRARLIIEFDSNSAAEVLGIDNVEFTEGRRVGDGSIEVPQLVGLTQESAIAAILETGLSLGVIDSIPSVEWAAGLVVQQNPVAAYLAEPGSEVAISISTGIQDTIPPEIICPEDIILSLDPSGCGTRVSFEVTANDNNGNVAIETSIPSGSFFSLGTTEVTAVATDEAGNTSSCSFNVIIQDSTDKVLEIRGFVLIDADQDREIMEITDGMTIDLSVLSTENLNIRAVGSADIESVGFVLTGEHELSRKENFTPFALFGDYQSDYVAHRFREGSYQLTATPYPAKNLSGNAGQSFTVNFKIGPSSEGTNVESLAEAEIDSIIISEEETGKNSIEQLVLVDALNNRDIMVLEDGWVIDVLKIIKTRFNIRAEATSDVGSVAFELRGPVHVRRTENQRPFSLFGDRHGDYYPGDLPIGNYKLTVTPFARRNLQGVAGSPMVINFTVIEGNGGLLLKIYPKPDSSAIWVDVAHEVKEQSLRSLLIHDIQGRLIRSISHSELRGQSPYEIATEGIPAGIYVMSAQNKEGARLSKTFIVEK